MFSWFWPFRWSHRSSRLGQTLPTCARSYHHFFAVNEFKSQLLSNYRILQRWESQQLVSPQWTTLPSCFTTTMSSSTKLSSSEELTYSRQRPKKSQLSGWQTFTRKNFPDEVRKLFSRHVCQKRVNRFATCTKARTLICDMFYYTASPLKVYIHLLKHIQKRDW